MTLILDNYDSFTYNLYQALCALGSQCTVVRNDAATLRELEALRPERLLISPGPGVPQDAGQTCAAVAHFAGKIPILGVCLGHQAIGLVFGGQVVRARRPVHGKQSPVSHDGRGIYRGLESPFTAARYHSLVVSPNGLSPELEISARTADGTVMGIRHKRYPIEGVQFHPESIATPEGIRLLGNFLEAA